MTGGLGIAFAPLLPWPALAALGALSVLVVGLALVRRARGTGGWALAAATLLAALANPSLTVEERRAESDIVLIAVDESASQDIADRRAATAAALAHLEAAVAARDGLDSVVVRTGPETPEDPLAAGGTRLVSAIERGLADIPEGRLAGIVAITDGQVHDVPEPPAGAALPGPLHVLLTGAEGERDRRVVITEAPGYGLVGKALAVTARVEDLGGGEGNARIAVRQDGRDIGSFVVPVGRDVPIDVTLERAGPSIVEVEVEAGADELTAINNRTAVAINGVRDRLRVLLISGEPHAGERAWRNLLKADPAVDLVHFTILRPPEKQDGTPVRELSLISFPVRELFEVKLDEFDLVVFDRYRRRGVMLQRYVENIVEYVRNGGALLAAVGPTFASPLSMFNSPLGDLMPAMPTGDVLSDPYRPGLTETGRRHPVTAGMPGAGSNGDAAAWGRWFRYIDVLQARGTALMSGPAGKPLLILDRVGEGRVALLLSDHIWLWARGYDGGGPQAELVRRLAHWLMREPELEEDRLWATVHRRAMTIERRTLVPDDTPATVTTPSGETVAVALEEGEDGVARGTLAIDEPGVYVVRDGTRTATAAAGDLDRREYADVRATAARLGPLAEAGGGAVFWPAADGLPEVRQVRPGQTYAGRHAATGQPWLGLRANRSHAVTGLTAVPALPALLVLALAAAGLLLAWHREGR